MSQHYEQHYDYIFHLADLHIRDGNETASRYAEYDTVFRATIADMRRRLEADAGARAVCVVCGDVLHHKMRISSPGIKLWHRFVKGVTDLMDMVVINGNHDMSQERCEDAHNDMVEAMLLAMTDPEMCSRHERVRYLSRTGTYRYANLEFGVVVESDIVREGASSGLVRTLPAFPTPTREPGVVRVALAHCTVRGCAMEDASRSPDGVPVSWFDEYDYALLGDVHAQQVHRRYAYPGSLVQQSFKEPLFPHGYLVWRVEPGGLVCADRAHIPNSRGFLKAVVQDGALVESGGERRPLSELLSDPRTPRALHVRLYTRHDPQPHLDRLRATPDRDFVVDVIRMSDRTPAAESVTMRHPSRCNNAETVRTFLRNTVGIEEIDVAFVMAPGTVPIAPGTPAAVEADVAKRGAELVRKLEGLAVDADPVRTSPRDFRLISANWDWILSFGVGNVFEFGRSGMTLLHAPNGYGKSAFFEVVVLGLFGTSVPSRKGPVGRNLVGAINRRRPSGACPPRIETAFDLDGVRHTIVRVFKEDAYADGRPRVKCKPTLYREGVMLRENNRAVDGWIEEHLFGLEDFLMFNMITQHEDCDFVRMSDKEQQARLDSVSQTDRYARACAALKEVRSYCTHAVQKMQSFVEGAQPARARPTDADSESLRSTTVELRSAWEAARDRAAELRVGASVVDTCRFEELPYRPDDDTPPDESARELLDARAVLSQHVRQARSKGIAYPVDYGDEANGDFEGMMSRFGGITSADVKEVGAYGALCARAEELRALLDTDAKFLRASSRDSTAIAPERSRSQLVAAIETHESRTHERAVQGGDSEEEIGRLRATLDADANALLDKFDAREAAVELRRLKDRVIRHDAHKEASTQIAWRDLLFEHEARHERWQGVLHRLIQLNAILDERPVVNNARHRALLKERRALKIERDLLEREYDTQSYEDALACHRALERYRVSEDGSKMAEGERDAAALQIRRLSAYGSLADARARVRAWDAWCAWRSERDELEVAMADLEWWDLHEEDMRNEALRAQLDRVEARATSARAVRALSTRAARADVRIAELDRKLAYYARAARRYRTQARDAEEAYQTARERWTETVYLTKLWVEFDAVVAILTPQMRELERRKELAQRVIRSEGGYKAWVYNDHLLPVVCAHVNEVLRVVFQERDLVFNMEFENDKLVMGVIDEGNPIFVEKLSGAQSFMLGLAVRIGLRDMGISRYVCGQLFVDEGFCAFDQANLAKVPTLFDSLRRSYREMVLVTHLEDVKHLVRHVVPIERAKGVSRLHHTARS